VASLRSILGFVKFEHTLFSIPLLLAGAFLGARGVPEWRPLVWVIVAGVGARTVALALNRILDSEIDARNPRTASRELPSGKMSPMHAWLVTLAGLLVFYVAVFNLPPLCWKLSPIPLVIFVVYPLLKRFTALAHFGVGAALAFGPIGAYVAVTGQFLPLGAVHLLALFTLLWVAGFDVIYATLDEGFDRREGLHSFPSVLGRVRALRGAAILHAAAFAILAAMTHRDLSTPAAWAILAVIGVLLIVEHRQAHRVDLAFFKINAVLGFVIFALVWVGLPAG
jgi:4-hydroxybenzoate polyprenyltransferase